MSCAHAKFADDENEISLKRIINPLYFRFGFYNEIKINLNYFIEYEFTPETWYKIDILFDWERRQTALYVNEEF